MDPKEWDELVNSVRKQINDLRTTLTQNEASASGERKVLEDAKHDVELLMEAPANPRDVLFQLPLTLQALTSQKLIGVFLLGSDGKVVLHHGSCQRLLKIDPETNSLPSGCFFDGPSGELIADNDLPWRCGLRGEAMPPTSHLMMRDATTEEELHLEVSAIPLRSNDTISGVVTLFRDKTETVRAGQYIKELCQILEKQLSGIEAAQRELQLFAEKLLETTGSRQAGAPSAPTIHPSTKTKPGKRVLIVDDIPVNQKLLVMHLKKFDVETEVANNGLEAVNCIKKQRYALVLMDIDMPIMNGFEATAEIRKLEDPQGIHTPIVAITSFDRDVDKEKCLQRGMDEFIPKGSSKGILRELVDRYVFGISSSNVTTHEPKPPSGELKLDLRWLQEHLGGESDKVVSLFLGSAAMLLNCLEFAIEDKEASAVTHFAFSLKGPCSSMGLVPMADKAAELANEAEQSKWIEADSKYKELCLMFQTVKTQAGVLWEGQLAGFP